MYNLRVRARTTIAGSVRPHMGMGVRASPAQTSQVTPTQAMEMFEEAELVPETEIDVSEVNFDSDVASGVVVTEEATQPPTHIMHSDDAAPNFRDFTHDRRLTRVTSAADSSNDN